MRSIRPSIVALLALLALAGCGGATGSPPAATPGATARDGGQGGTAARAYNVDEALAADVDGPILVTGLLIDDGGGWRMCGAIAESYPPQCAGGSMTVEGLDAAQFDLQEASGVRWNESATLFGELDNATLTVTGPASAS